MVDKIRPLRLFTFMDYKQGYGYTEVLKFFNNNELSLVPSRWTSMVRKNLFEMAWIFKLCYLVILMSYVRSVVSHI